MLPALPVVDAAAPVIALADAEAVHRVAVVGLDDDLDKVALARAGVGHEPVEGLAPDVEGDIAEAPVVDARDVAVIPGVEGGDDAGVAGDGEAVSAGAAVVPVPVPVPGDQIRHVRATDVQGLEIVAVGGLDGDGDRSAVVEAGGRSRRNAAADAAAGRHGVGRGLLRLGIGLLGLGLLFRKCGADGDVSLGHGEGVVGNRHFYTLTIGYLEAVCNIIIAISSRYTQRNSVAFEGRRRSCSHSAAGNAGGVDGVELLETNLNSDGGIPLGVYVVRKPANIIDWNRDGRTVTIFQLGSLDSKARVRCNGQSVGPVALLI